MTPDARREPAGEEGLSSDQPAAKLTDTEHSTDRGLTVDRSEVLMLEAELDEILGRTRNCTVAPSTQCALSDASRVARVLVDTFGPAWCRSLVAELERRVVIGDG